MKAAAWRNDAEAVKMVSGFVFRDFGCEQRRLAAVSRWHIVAAIYYYYYYCCYYCYYYYYYYYYY